MNEKIVRTTDTDIAAFLLREGLVFLRADACQKRAAFVFRDSKRGHGDAVIRAFLRDRRLREFLASRRLLRRALRLAQAAPTGICSASDLEAERAAWARAQERRQHDEIGHREPRVLLAILASGADSQRARPRHDEGKGLTSNV